MVKSASRSQKVGAFGLRSAVLWAAVLSTLSLSGCLGDFLTTAQIDQKLDAYAASLDVDALGADTSLPDTLAGDSTATADSTSEVDQLEPDVGCDHDLECDDQDPCTIDTCQKDGTCSNKHGNDGASCDDGNQCTLNDKCIDGTCHPGDLKDCNDKNVCTYDACQIAVGCTHTQDYGSTCDDNDECTLDDTCAAGKCVGTPKNCGADDCTTAKCLNGKCNSASKLDGTKCSDGDACTTGDTCKNGLCLPVAQTTCDDNNACTADSCEPIGGCLHDLLSDPCSDGDPCTVGDQCESGACKGGIAKVCNDGNDCTGDVCNPVSGACDATPITATCNDGNPCTQGDACNKGACQPGGAAQCDDGNPCTEDACSPDTGACNHVATSGLCEDGNGCTVGDTCKAGKCEGGGEKVCVDADTCTSDSCDATTGSCVHAAIIGCGDICAVDGDCKPLDVCTIPACLSGKCAYLPTAVSCDDKDPCTQGDSCQGGACKAGAAVNCDDGNPCTDDSCDSKAGTCSHAANADACSDGDACTVGDTCAGSKCTAGPLKSCDDSNPCTNDTCDTQSGNCSSGPNALDCDDKNPCTIADVCKAGACSSGALKNCDDGNACTADACDSKTGTCTASNTTAPCDDGNACSAGDACQNGACTSGSPKNCDDSNPCTNDTCDAQTGDCSHAANAAACSDGNACTISDVCLGGACKPGADAVCADTDTCTTDACDKVSGNCVFKPITGCGGNCAKASDCDDTNPCTDDACTAGKCAFPPNTVACSDNNACTSGDICASGSCKAGSAKNCDDGNPCTDDSCDSKTGTCVNTANVATCDDANACTQGDVCGAGACKPGLAANCSDGKVCTDDSCDTKTGTCKNTANTAACDDKNPCTLGDVCASGTCTAGAPANCDDSNACTSDSCDLNTGSCAHVNNTLGCSDGNACTLSDSCAGGTCKAGSAKLCTDGKPCTDDSCNSQDGTCLYTANTATCDDGSACTSGDKCAASACVPGPSKTCNDNDACTTDTCDAGSGSCVFAPIVGCGGNCAKNLDCSDGNTCTDNVCSGGKCTFPANTLACSDNNACTNGDICAAGKCTAGTAKNCDDNNPCTNDTCDTTTGACVYVNTTGACTDNNACTKVDTCQAGACKPGLPQLCNDSNACTDDSCNTATGACVATNNTATCSDNTACTTNDVCAAGACKGGPALNCDDNNVCTTDSCDAATGCTKVNNNASCSDGSACTSGDTCASGACSPGAAVVCNDNNICTNDTCDPASGCKYAANTAACDDGNKCTLSDICAATNCKAGGAKDCADADNCTSDSCDPGSGSCAHTPIIGCGGYCATAADCNDGNACTNDACTAGKCTSTNNTITCNDSDACTTGEICGSGKCAGTGALPCDDANPCTNDSCDKSLGCQKVNNTVACNDNDACTTGDVCAASKCAGPGTLGCDDSNPCTNDSCDKLQGCLHANNTQSCNDSDACTTGDLCSGGVCAGTAVVCDDKNDCTTDSCSKTTGCVFTTMANGTACNDNNACTVGDYCQGSTCKPGTQVWVDILAGAVPTPNGGANAGSLADGFGAKARFNTPVGIAFSSYSQKLYVADTYNHAIREMTLDGTVTTLAGGSQGSKDGTGGSASFYLPNGVAAGQKSTLYVADTNNHTLRAVDTSSGTVTTLVGNGQPGFANGSGLKEAQLNLPMGLAVSLTGLVAIADSGNHAIRLYDPATQQLTTLAGIGSAGSSDGGGSSGSNKPSFNKPVSLAFDANGSLFVVDMYNHKLRKVTATGQVSTIAGDGTAGMVDSTNLAAVEFNYPSAVTTASWGPVFITDSYNARVRRGGPNGVSTLAGGGGSVAAAPALQSAFNLPSGIAADDSGFLYVADTYNHLIRRIRDTNNPCNVGGVCYTNNQVAPTSPCQICQGGSSFTARPSGALCSDTDLCTTGEACTSTGACMGQPLNCSDGNVCTDDTCDALTGGKCNYTSNVATCNDGNPCTLGETCQYSSCIAPSGSTPCDDKNQCTIDSCTISTTGAAVCSYAPAGSETSCAPPNGANYGLCRGTVCAGLEQATAVGGSGGGTRLLDVSTDKAGGITAVGQSVTGSSSPQGTAFTVNATAMPLTMSAQWTAAEELWSIRGRLLTGGHSSIGANPLDTAAFTATYTGTPAYTAGGPTLPNISRMLRSTAMVVDPNTNAEEYMSGGVGDGSTTAPPSTLYRYRYVPGTSSWDASAANGYGEMGIATSYLGNSNLCLASMSAAVVTGIYQPNLSETFVALNTVGTSSAGYVAYWQPTQSQNSFCSKVAPGGTLDLTVNDQRILGTGGGGQIVAVNGSSGTNVIALGSAAYAGSPVIWSFNGTTWTSEYPNPKTSNTSTQWSNSTFVPQAVAVLDKEAFVGGVVTISGCKQLFVLHGSRTTGPWTWDHLKVTSNTIYNCESGTQGRVTLTRAWAQPGTGSVYFTGSAAVTSTGSTMIANGQNSTGQVGLLLRIK